MYFNATFTDETSIIYFVRSFTVYIHDSLTFSESLMMLSSQCGTVERASNYHFFFAQNCLDEAGIMSSLLSGTIFTTFLVKQ